MTNFIFQLVLAIGLVIGASLGQLDQGAEESGILVRKTRSPFWGALARVGARVFSRGRGFGSRLASTARGYGITNGRIGAGAGLGALGLTGYQYYQDRQNQRG